MTSDPRDLVGSWTIERALLDRVLDQRGTFDGTLIVEPADVGLRWYETGSLHWDGRSVPAQRTLGLRQSGGNWWMTFADGRLFHPWSVDEPVTHPCADDTYRGEITLDAPDELTISWQVNGPAKDQLIVTTYHRSSERD